MSMLHKILQKTESIPPNLFPDTSITFMPKPGKKITTKENHRTKSLMNMETNSLTNFLKHRIQQCIKKIHQGLSQEHKVGFFI